MSTIIYRRRGFAFGDKLPPIDFPGDSWQSPHESRILRNPLFRNRVKLAKDKSPDRVVFHQVHRRKIRRFGLQQHQGHCRFQGKKNFLCQNPCIVLNFWFYGLCRGDSHARSPKGPSSANLFFPSSLSHQKHCHQPPFRFWPIDCSISYGGTLIHGARRYPWKDWKETFCDSPLTASQRKPRCFSPDSSTRISAHWYKSFPYANNLDLCIQTQLA